MTKSLRKLGVLAAAAALAAGCGRRNVVAKYDGHSITMQELKEEVEKGPPFQKARFQSPEGRKAVLEEVLKQRLLVWEAERRGLGKDPDVLFRVRDFRNRLLQDKLQTQVANSVQPTPEDIKGYYDAHQNVYNIPELVRVRRLLVANEREAREALKEIRRKAPQPAQLAQAFSEVVKEKSIDGLTKPQGGDTGYFPRGARQEDAAFEAAAFKLKPNEVAGPVHTKGGWDLFLLVDHRDAIHRSLDEAREDARQRIIMERQHGALEQMLEGIRKSAGVKIYEDRLK